MLWQRDVNSSKNMFDIAQAIVHIGIRPTYFQRPNQITVANTVSLVAKIKILTKLVSKFIALKFTKNFCSDLSDANISQKNYSKRPPLNEDQIRVATQDLARQSDDSLLLCHLRWLVTEVRQN